MKKNNLAIAECDRRFTFAMQMAGLRPCTILRYSRSVLLTSQHVLKPPHDIECSDVLLYLEMLFNTGKSGSTIIGAYAALKFYLTRVSGKPWTINRIPRLPPYRKQQARTLTRKEIRQFLDAAPPGKYRVLFSLAYSSGLRVSEVCALKVADIDMQEHQIFIKDSKGGKHRTGVLSRKLAAEIKHYLAVQLPGTWLFPSERRNYENLTLFPENKVQRPISARSVQREFFLLKERLGYQGAVTFHSLRHSFASHAVEYGMPLFSLQRLLGHRELGTTLAYLRSVDSPVVPDFSPLDKL